MLKMKVTLEGPPASGKTIMGMAIAELVRSGTWQPDPTHFQVEAHITEVDPTTGDETTTVLRNAQGN